MNIKKVLDSKLSRRSLLIDAGKITAGAACTLAVLSGQMGLPATVEAKGLPADKWPWPYEKLDPEKTAELAYKEWYRVYCGCAVISSVFTQLREKVGEPYTSFPIDSFVFLEGGTAGWGTICGSVAGANIVSNVIIGPRTEGPECFSGALIGSELLEWYSDSKLPVYVPKQPKVTDEIVQTKSESPLCHVSVGKWMGASGFSLSSPERRDRCARVTASVAYQLVEHLNAWKDGKYESKASWAPGKEFGIPSQQNCTDCHGSDVPMPPQPKKA